MALILGDNFSYQGAKPLDGRLEYKTLADMKAVADATMYDGCIAYCVASDKTYQWKAANTVDADTGKWREFSSGGSSETTDYSDLDNKPSINDVTLSGNKSFDDLGINLINDLANYYLKTEVDDIVTAIKNSRFEVVQTLPTENIKTNVIYLVPKSTAGTSNVKDEYINLNGTSSGWEKIGDTEVDLTDYVTNSDLTTALADYVTNAALATALNDYVASADLTTILADYALANNVHNIPAGGTAGQILQKKTNNDYDAEWVNNSGGGSAVVNGYAYTEPFDSTNAMDYINWVKDHTDKTINISDQTMFNNKTCNCFYMVLGPSTGYYLFGEYDFSLDVMWLNRSGGRIYNSSRHSTDGVDHPGYNSDNTFNYTNGITKCNAVTIKGSSEIDCDYLYDPEKQAQIFASANVTFRNPTTFAYKDNVVVIENSMKFYSDSSHTTEITPAQGKIYIDVPTGNMYEWNGTEYIQVGGSSGASYTAGSGISISQQNEISTDKMQSGDMADVVTPLPTPGGGGGTVYLDGLGDVDITTPSNGQTLVYNGTSEKWENGSGGGDTSKIYSTDDDAFTDIADGDYVPIYDTSATAKKKSLWSNIKSLLKTYFDTLYQSKISYSTSEKAIGTWVNGSTLYQKTFTGTLSSSSNDTKVTSWNTSYIIREFKGTIGSGNYAPITFYVSDTNMIIAYEDSGNIHIYAGNENKGKPYYLTILYTK